MHDLNFDLKQLCRRSRGGSFATQRDRERVFDLVADQLQEALHSRIVIEQAKGIIAQALGLEMDEAFAGLRRYARSGGRRLAQVAQGVVDGTLEPDAIAGPPAR